MHFLARPHVLAWPLLVVWMAQVIGAGDAGRVPSLLLLPIMILWCNLHGGFVVGLFLAGLFAAEAVLAAPGAGRLRAAAGWGRFLALATLAALVSPNGVSGLLLPFKMLGMKFALASISEWRSADFAGFDPLEAWIGLLILGGFTLAIRLPLSRILMLLLLLWAALVHVRNKELLGIVAPLLLAAPLARQLGPARPSKGNDAGRSETALAASAALVLAVVGFFAGAWALDRRGLAPRADVAPAAALAAAPRRARRTRVQLGGLWRVSDARRRPDLCRRPCRSLWRRVLGALRCRHRRHRQLAARAARSPCRAMDPARTGEPGGRPVGHLPGWQQVYVDPYAVIHRRTAPLAR